MRKGGVLMIMFGVIFTCSMALADASRKAFHARCRCMDEKVMWSVEG